MMDDAHFVQDISIILIPIILLIFQFSTLSTSPTDQNGVEGIMFICNKLSSILRFIVLVLLQRPFVLVFTQTSFLYTQFNSWYNHPILYEITLPIFVLRFSILFKYLGFKIWSFHILAFWNLVETLLCLFYYLFFESLLSCTAVRRCSLCNEAGGRLSFISESSLVCCSWHEKFPFLWCRDPSFSCRCTRYNALFFCYCWGDRQFLAHFISRG